MTRAHGTRTLGQRLAAASVPVKTAVVLAAVVTLAVSSLAGRATWAALTDTEHASAHVRSPAFDVVAVWDQTVHQAEPGTGARLPVDGADQLVPGRSVTATFGVASNSTLAARVTMSVAAEPVTNRPDIRDHLRITVVDRSDGTVLAGDPDDLEHGVGLPHTVDLGSLNARSDDERDVLADGDAWTAGAPGSRKTVDVIVYLSTATPSHLNGGAVAPVLTLAGESVVR